MPWIRHILFPVDFSEQSAAIRPFVKEMAKRFDADVTLLHVLEIPATFYPALDTAYVMDIDVDAMRKEAEERLASFYVGQAERVVEEGDPANVIVNYAAKHPVDLIMLATHGYGRLSGMLLGSVAAKVLHEAECPVWTAAHTSEPTLLSHIDFQSILCAVDLGEGSSELWKDAEELAAGCSARLRLVHAVTDADLLGAAREKAARMQQKAGTKLDQCVAGGEVSKVVRDAAEHNEADLVIIGRGKLRATMGRLRTHAYSIIRDSPCPVLSL
jgi:nucleotide-binding universal stress UspA family protein